VRLTVSFVFDIAFPVTAFAADVHGTSCSDDPNMNDYFLSDPAMNDDPWTLCPADM
jgi:hypothetical protein